MHKIYFRFKDVVSKKVYEVCLDERLSFDANFAMLEPIIGIDLRGVKIYDPYKKVFLDKEEPLSTFEFEGFIFLELFSFLKKET